MRGREVDEILEITAARTMIQSQKDTSKYYTAHECHLIMPQKMCYQRMKEFSDKLPTVGLLPVN